MCQLKVRNSKGAKKKKKKKQLKLSKTKARFKKEALNLCGDLKPTKKCCKSEFLNCTKMQIKVRFKGISCLASPCFELIRNCREGNMIQQINASKEARKQKHLASQYSEMQLVEI